MLVFGLIAFDEAILESDTIVFRLPNRNSFASFAHLALTGYGFALDHACSPS